jgi:hypothetical protein
MTLGAEALNYGAVNNVVSLTDTKSALPAGRGEAKCDDVLIHVRFHPNAEVNTIDQCPEHLSRDDWYYRLRIALPQNYQVFAGGRGFFRMERSCFEAALSESAA